MKYTTIKLKYAQISYQHGRDLKLEDEPGIYAWYREINFKDCVSNQDLFINKINKLLSDNLSDVFESKVGNIYDISLVENGGKLSAHKQNILKNITETVEGRQHLADILGCTNEFQSALYIGKAINIKKRIQDHVNGSSGLIKRFLNAGIDVEDCFLKIIYFKGDVIEDVSSYIDGDVDQAITLIEELATRLGPSAFVRRIG